MKLTKFGKTKNIYDHLMKININNVKLIKKFTHVTKKLKKKKLPEY